MWCSLKNVTFLCLDLKYFLCKHHYQIEYNTLYDEISLEKNNLMSLGYVQCWCLSNKKKEMLTKIGLFIKNTLHYFIKINHFCYFFLLIKLPSIFLLTYVIFCGFLFLLLCLLSLNILNGNILQKREWIDRVWSPTSGE